MINVLIEVSVNRDHLDMPCFSNFCDLAMSMGWCDDKSRIFSIFSGLLCNQLRYQILLRFCSSAWIGRRAFLWDLLSGEAYYHVNSIHLLGPNYFHFQHMSVLPKSDFYGIPISPLLLPLSSFTHSSVWSNFWPHLAQLESILSSTSGPCFTSTHTTPVRPQVVMLQQATHVLGKPTEKR
jgi:hypothetical protein